MSPRVTGPAGFEGRCNKCDITFSGEDGIVAMRKHRAESDPDPFAGSIHSQRIGPRFYDRPTWANGKALPWVAPKPSRVHTLEETLASWADFGVEVLS